MRDKDT